MNLKIMTFNIRYDTEADGKNCFAGRRNMIKDFLLREAPDLIGFQESVPVIRHYLAEALPEYAFLAVDAGDVLHNDVAIAYRRDRFDLFALDQFWLSPEPDVPYTRYPDQSPFPRMATQATLLTRGEAKPVTLLNTHLDHIGAGARLCGAKLLCERIAPFLESACFITGDFNARPREAPIRAIISDSSIKDITAPLGDDVASCHDYGKISKDMKIDYIFASQSVSVVDGTLTMHTDCEDGIYLSDHYPISVTVEI